MIEIAGVPLRDVLIRQMGIPTRPRRFYEDGRRKQITEPGLKSPRLEVARTPRGSVIIYAVPVAYEHVPRREYGPRNEDLETKFLRRVEKDRDGHWYWTGHLTHQGYGRFSVKVDGKYKTVGAHRWSFEFYNRPLEEGEVVDHLNDICGIRRCVNPAHLDGTTSEESARRGRVKLSLTKRETCNHGHVLAEVGIRINENGTAVCKQCERDKVIKSRDTFFVRRAEICYQQGLDRIVCEDGHFLDLENSLSKNGTCRECNRLYAASRRKAARGSAE
ncbi:MAG: HNH endonuclease [Candidatus Nanopelagicales bacterium]